MNPDTPDTPDTPKTPREELEVKLTALLMGELSAAEAAEVRAQMEADSELAALYASLRQAVTLLREASVIHEPAPEPVPAQLSAERRGRLLAHFQSPASPEMKVLPAPKDAGLPKRPRPDTSWLASLGVAAALTFFVGLSFLMPSFFLARKSSQANRVLEDLRSIDEEIDQKDFVASSSGQTFAYRTAEPAPAPAGPAPTTALAAVVPPPPGPPPTAGYRFFRSDSNGRAWGEDAKPDGTAVDAAVAPGNRSGALASSGNAIDALLFGLGDSEVRTKSGRVATLTPSAPASAPSDPASPAAGATGVEMESKFVELTQNNQKELSFDWLLGAENKPKVTTGPEAPQTDAWFSQPGGVRAIAPEPNAAHRLYATPVAPAAAPSAESAPALALNGTLNYGIQTAPSQPLATAGKVVVPDAASKPGASESKKELADLNEPALRIESLAKAKSDSQPNFVLDPSGRVTADKLASVDRGTVGGFAGGVIPSPSTPASTPAPVARRRSVFGSAPGSGEGGGGGERERGGSAPKVVRAPAEAKPAEPASRLADGASTSAAAANEYARFATPGKAMVEELSRTKEELVEAKQVAEVLKQQRDELGAASESKDRIIAQTKTAFVRNGPEDSAGRSADWSGAAAPAAPALPSAATKSAGGVPIVGDVPVLGRGFVKNLDAGVTPQRPEVKLKTDDVDDRFGRAADATPGAAGDIAARGMNFGNEGGVSANKNALGLEKADEFLEKRRVLGGEPAPDAYVKLAPVKAPMEKLNESVDDFAAISDRPDSRNFGTNPSFRGRNIELGTGVKGKTVADGLADGEAPKAVEFFSTANRGFVEGFGEGKGEKIKELPMPNHWSFVMRDGSIGSSSLATAENPVVGRTGFWTDDETGKANINSASEGTFWDTPAAGAKDSQVARGLGRKSDFDAPQIPQSFGATVAAPAKDDGKEVERLSERGGELPALTAGQQAQEVTKALTQLGESDADGGKVVSENARSESMAQREMARRRDYKERSAEAIEAGQKALSEKDYETAVKQFKLAKVITPDAPSSESLAAEALNGYTDASNLYAEQKIAEGKYSDAATQLKEVLKDNPGSKRSTVLLSRLETPDYYNKTADPKTRSKSEQVKQYATDAKGLMDSGRYDLAMKRADQVLALDPYNVAAREMQERINSRRNQEAQASVNEARSSGLWKLQNAWKSPVRSFAKGGESEESNKARINSKLESIVLPKLEFRDATVREALDYLRRKSVELDDGESDVTKRGVSFVLKEGARNDAPESSPNPADTRITLSLSNVPVNVAIGYITSLAGMKYRVDPYAVAIMPSSDDMNTLVTKEYKVPPGFVDRIKNSDETIPTDPALGKIDAVEFLRSAGLPFPEGASAVYVAANNSLVIRNTQENLDTIDQISVAANPADPDAAENGSAPSQGISALEAGQKAAAEGDYETAASQFELARTMIPDAPASHKLREIADAGLAEATAKIKETTAPQPAPPADPPQKKVDEPAPTPQPEVSTKENAFSTFSLNVADVAFKLAEASLEQGKMPELATLRTEEFINALDYRDPEPGPGAALAFNSERARYPFAQNRDLLRLSVKTAAAGRQPGRALNIVLLLDNSGSMERADRVRIVRESLRVLAAQLQPQDKLSIITFARTPRLWIDGVAGDQAGEATGRVGQITPEGGTNISTALDLGYETALRHYKPGTINRVVLMTDGAANLGDVNPEALKKKVEANRKQGIALDCFGIGWEGYDDNLLETLSRNGDGRYGFVNTPAQAATEFAGQLAGALRVAASDVKVQVEFNPRRVTSYRQLGYAKHQLKKEQFRDNTVDAAEIGAAESGNALYTMEINPRGEGDIAAVRVRYKVPGTSDYREQEWTVPYNIPAAPLDQSSSAMRLAGTAGAFAEWLASSPYATEVTPDQLLGLINGVPAIYGADPRPGKLEAMIRQAKNISGR